MEKFVNFGHVRVDNMGPQQNETKHYLSYVGLLLYEKKRQCRNVGPQNCKKKFFIVMQILPARERPHTS